MAGKRAEVVAGIFLMLVGSTILYEHLSAARQDRVESKALCRLGAGYSLRQASLASLARAAATDDD